MSVASQFSRFLVRSGFYSVEKISCLCGLSVPYSKSWNVISQPKRCHSQLTRHMQPLTLELKQKHVTILRHLGDNRSNTNETDKVLTVPNILTFGRLCSAPVIAYFVLTDAFPYALCLFGIAGVTDLIDGYIARRWKGQTSVLGSMLDPLADKVLVTCLSLSLCYVDLLPVWLVSLILLRDFCLVIGAGYLRFTSLPSPRSLAKFLDVTLPTIQIRPLLISKFNTGVQLLLIISSLSAPVFNYVDHPYLQGLCYFTAVTTLLSGIGYIFSRDTFTIIGKRRR